MGIFQTPTFQRAVEISKKEGRLTGSALGQAFRERKEFQEQRSFRAFTRRIDRRATQRTSALRS
jgi:hypothetical protein